MAIIRDRQISDSEKELVLKRFGRICFATGHKIPDDEDIQFDHIKAFSNKGQSEIDNIAPMCKMHNLQKGRLPLEDFRVKLKINEFFLTGKALTLKDELIYLKNKNLIKEFGNPVYFKKSDKSIEIEINSLNHSYHLHKCPITEWEYFYAIVPVSIINSDDDEDGEDGEVGLQPRYLIKDKVFNLYRHFLSHPVLQPSLARLQNNKILVFDGQHKIASMLWDNRKVFELKIYLSPQADLLNKTNIDAHDTFAQTRFYSSVMVSKLGSQFGKLFDNYKNAEDDSKKSEKGFVDYLKVTEQLTNAEVNKRFKSFLFDLVIDEQENQITKLISKSNRSTDEYPLTIDMLSKSLLSNFLYLAPIEEELISERYKREIEIANIVALFNMFYEESLHQWDHTKPKSDLTQLKLKRIIRSKSIMSWSEILRDAIGARLKLYDGDEKALLFYRELSKEQLEEVRTIVQRLLNWNFWNLPEDSEIDRKMSDNKSEVKKYFKEKGLTTGYLLGAPE